ncbi:hypothetical protein EJ04DRAFT_569554 [Polyplosphaeria fusca]|uniref:Uncharacterized protein n=1 Tax=Polyplosphaeria fusca TaxID=682080 RepID=A0A9P4QMJ9_9PLEO|nr:hypothetical protein EJ04DRAFT_569554 [Polyplosphaeria fusca]
MGFNMSLSSLLVLLCCLTLASSTNIGTFTDSKCADTVDNLRGPNGYPNGTCTHLNLKNGTSFQLIDVDPGCAVTIYGPDTSSDPCSADILAVAEIAKCYNASWVYYSIDGCDIPSEIPSSSSSSQSPTSTPPSSASATPQSSPNHTGVIVGGVVGGVAAIALVAIAVLLLLRYRRKNKTDPTPPLQYEMGGERQVAEVAPPEKPVQTEMYAHNAAFEMGRNSLDIPGAPVELSAGDPSNQEGSKHGVAATSDEPQYPPDQKYKPPE